MKSKIDDKPLISGLAYSNSFIKINKYKTEFTGLCPNDKNLIDNYKITIHSEKMIMVEKINEYLSKFKNKAIYQEDLTIEISDYFNCKIKLTGIHLGVKIKSIAK